MRRSIVFAIVALVALATAGGVLAAPKLTAKNSVVYKFFTSSNEKFFGTNCGATSTIVKTLPTGSTGIKVVSPKLGERDDSNFAQSGTQITAISVNGTAVTLTALADGPLICDPAQTGVPPGQPVNWNSQYKFEADYSRRVATVIRVYYESYLSGAKWKTRPKTIQDSRKGTPRSFRERYVHLKWKSFGGKKAIATGIAKLDYCPAGGNCPENNGKARLVATKPRYCIESGKFEYLNLDVYINGRFSRGTPLRCTL
jgi:hypothetical protein